MLRALFMATAPMRNRRVGDASDCGRRRPGFRANRPLPGHSENAAGTTGPVAGGDAMGHLFGERDHAPPSVGALVSNCGK